MKTKKRTKWGVVFADGKYISDPRGGQSMGWTYNKAEAQDLAESFGEYAGGRIVDAEAWTRRENERRAKLRAGLEKTG